MRAVLACLCLLLVPLHSSAADWVRVETANLVVFGPGEKRTREVTAEFERFREAIGQVLPGATIASPVPTIVVVFENDHAFNPYRPRFNGKPIRLGGFYTGTESDNMIAFPYGDRQRGLRVIFHEYTHLITATAARALPPWVGEGLAEFYSTFEIDRSGKEAILGQVIPSHVALLTQTSRWLPLDQLLTVTHESPLYNEGERRSIFYAQSWAMVHLFMTGEPNRSKEFARYVQLTGAGMAPLDAWKKAFGDLDVEKELRHYLSRFTLRAFLYRFAEGVAPVKAEASTPRPADVDAVLSRLLRYGNDPEMEPRLLRAVGATPPSTLARALLGHSYIHGSKNDEGLRLLVEAAADRNDWLVQYYVASGIARSGGGSDAELLAVARRATDAVIAARPQLAHGHALKASLLEGTEGVAAIRKARTLAPGREDYAFIEAQLRANLRDFPGARTAIAPLLNPNLPPDVREAARSLMGQIVRREEFESKRAAAAPSSPVDNDRPAASSVPPGVLWVFRDLQPGEVREEGTLERIDCAPGGAVTLSVKISGEVKRYAAPAFSDVDFIIYREEPAGKITCGQRKPAEPVYITWRPIEKPPAGVTGRPVAVEFLPDRQD